MTRTLIAVLGIAVSVGNVAGQNRLPAAGRNTISAGTYAAPRTPDGQPDLEGTWWRNSATPLERPKALEGRPSLTDDEVTELNARAARIFRNSRSDFAAGDNVFLAALANVEEFKNPAATCSAPGTNFGTGMVEREFDNRTSLIVDPPDGKIPPLTPEALRRRAAARAAAARLPESAEDLSDALRCITFGVPRLGNRFADPDYSYHQILQTSGYVVLHMEMMHDARLIPLDGQPHLPESIRQWNGDSRGRWEGETLVVDTTNFSPTSHLTGSFSALTNFMESLANLHLIERFTRVAPDTISYEITLDDPTTWTKPWTVEIRLKRTQSRIYEYACHEGNAHTMVGILAGARAEEKAAAEVVKKGSR